MMVLPTWENKKTKNNPMRVLTIKALYKLFEDFIMFLPAHW